MGTRSSSSRSPCTISCPERFHGSYRWTWMWSTGPTSGNCFRNLTTSQKERLSASPEKCSRSIGTSSGSIGRNIPGPRWGSHLRTGCPASTVACCCWTWRPCASQSATTFCWSRRRCSSWPASSTSRATWGTRTSSPWWAWSTLSCSTSWTALGTASSAPGGVTMATATSLSTTSTATATSASTMGTATPPSRQNSGGGRCRSDQRGSGEEEIGGGLGGLLRNSLAAAPAVCRGLGVLSSLGRTHCLELQPHLALGLGRRGMLGRRPRAVEGPVRGLLGPGEEAAGLPEVPSHLLLSLPLAVPAGTPGWSCLQVPGLGGWRGPSGYPVAY